MLSCVCRGEINGFEGLTVFLPKRVLDRKARDRRFTSDPKDDGVRKMIIPEIKYPTLVPTLTSDLMNESQYIKVFTAKTFEPLIKRNA